MVKHSLSEDLPGHSNPRFAKPGRSIVRQVWKIGLVVCLALLFAALLGDLKQNPGLSNPHNQPALEASNQSGLLDHYPWLFTRRGIISTPDEKVVEVVVVGDVMLGRSVIGKNDVFSGVSRWLSLSYIVLGNFEGAISSLESGECMSQASAGKVALMTPFASLAGGIEPYCLAVPPPAVATLQRAGFDILGLANNHALDLGEIGLQETRQRLQRAGIAVVGSPKMDDGGSQSGEIVFRRAGGLRLAFLAFNTVSMPGLETGWDLQRALESIHVADDKADAVIVSMHWGEEYSKWANPSQSQVAKEMVEAGADLVVGHHPHVVQGTQVFERGDGSIGFATYSLGNFVFDQFELNTLQGLALRARFDAHGLRAVQALPLITGLHPVLVPPDYLDLPGRSGEYLEVPGPWSEFMKRVRPPARRLAFACKSQGCLESPAPPEWRSGIFWSGQIDLTGEGQPEIVRRVRQRVRVYDGDQLTWESPPEWQVVDVALGDPNDDGRMEMLLAIRRQGRDGQWNSQPFIIGYRGGIYRQLWGGSPVVDPIQEVELGDVDGDGIQDMVVLEARPGGKQAISVWRWHGWGFALAWRSSERLYQNLVLLPHPSGPMLIGVEWPW